MPQLALSWAWSADGRALTLHLRPGVLFQDGEKLDAADVKASLERYRSAPESLRKSELKPVTSIDVLDPLTLRLNLSAPDAPLLSVLADRAGMPLAPRTLALGARAIALHPVCAGPFRFVQRVAQDHITLERFKRYWNATAIHVDRIVYRTMVNPQVRLANLEAGQLDLIEQVAASDVAALKRNPALRLSTAPALAYASLAVNLAHGPAANTPFARDPRIREAFEAALDRRVINQVALAGEFTPSNQMQPDGSPWWNPAYPIPARDLVRARALMRAAGQTRLPVTLLVSTIPVDGQIGQIIQAMEAEAGFDVHLRTMESAALVAAAQRGDFQVVLVLWSGRVDPDGNIAIWLACDGFLNRGTIAIVYR